MGRGQGCPVPDVASPSHLQRTRCRRHLSTSYALLGRDIPQGSVVGPLRSCLTSSLMSWMMGQSVPSARLPMTQS